MGNETKRPGLEELRSLAAEVVLQVILDDTVAEFFKVFDDPGIEKGVEAYKNFVERNAPTPSPTEGYSDEWLLDSQIGKIYDRTNVSPTIIRRALKWRYEHPNG